MGATDNGRMVRDLDDERQRQGLTKEQLARKCGMLSTSVRRIFSANDPDVKVSTLNKLASALGATLQIKKVDVGLDAQQSRHLINRLRRRSLAERLAKKSGLDAGDIEHALFNLTLTPTQRLVRRLHRARTRHR